MDGMLEAEEVYSKKTSGLWDNDKAWKGHHNSSLSFL